MTYRHLLIDWLTLRIPLDDRLGRVLHERILACLGRIQCYDSEGVLQWQKHALDVDKLRSDTVGLLWQVTGDGIERYLVIAASPASLEHGCNVFGSMDIRHCANVIIRAASKVLCAMLPPLEHWQCQRIDITGNYLLPDPEACTQLLKQLLVTDGSRRKASSAKRGGDTVSWNPTSDLTKGKAYHKGPQLRYLCKRGKVSIAEELLRIADRIVRLEHTRGARFFRRLREARQNWFDFTVDDLWDLYRDFFERLVSGVEVKDMDRIDIIRLIKDANGVSTNQAQSVFTTLRNIKADGFETVKGYMAYRTFCLHLRYLRAAGITDADLHTAKVLNNIQPIRIALALPMSGWDQGRIAA